MLYRYEMHMHGSQASKCAKSTAAEMIRAYHEAGYTGAVLTDHFIHGNTSVPQILPWIERMEQYEDAWRSALPTAQKLDFDLIFGFEHLYGNWKELLIYGIEPAFLKAHPELEYMEVEEFCRCIHEGGGYISHAHPYRLRSYMGSFMEPVIAVCDAVEVYNFSDPEENNIRSERLAAENGLRRLSGSDSHWTTYEGIGQAGMAFTRRLHNTLELADALRNGEGSIILAGRIEEK